MRIFHCDHCRRAIFFENTYCENCGHKLAYLPDLGIVASLDPADGQSSDNGVQQVWTSPVRRAEGKRYRLCANYVNHGICNWALPAESSASLCESCRPTRVIPDLSGAGNLQKWGRLEVAKRRLMYSLMDFGLPIKSLAEDPKRGLEFRFVGDAGGGGRILTGHENGVITINIAEADDIERERARVSMHEPYRTVLGHFRHESGHHFWDVLIKDTPRLDEFRKIFGDERDDYNAALQKYYREGPKRDWQRLFISAYAVSHPWEDWAETWAHYLLMTDALETAAVCGLSLQPEGANEPIMDKEPANPSSERPFSEIISRWFPLTYVLNNLNRGIGLPDAYPFVLMAAIVDKLRFVHDTICANHEKGNA